MIHLLLFKQKRPTLTILRKCLDIKIMLIYFSGLQFYAKENLFSVQGTEKRSKNLYYVQEKFNYCMITVQNRFLTFKDYLNFCVESLEHSSTKLHRYYLAVKFQIFSAKNVFFVCLSSDPNENGVSFNSQHYFMP